VNRSVLFHVQYLLGIGHLQRALRIASALAHDGIRVTLINGGPTAAGLAIDPAVQIVQLDAVRARDARFELIDERGRPIDDALRARRREALLAAFAKARPDAIVIEGFPFARRAFAFELDPLIAAAHAATPRTMVVCSVRDIIAWRDDPARHRGIAEHIKRDFDAVLVHGDPRLIRFDASFPAASDIADRLIYTGYVYEGLPPPARPGSSIGGSPPPQAREEHGVREVVVSAGGGAAGAALLNAALAARRNGCLADAPWRLLSGTNLPQAEYDALCRDAPAGVTIERFRPDLPALLRRCRVSVSQAGYNTVLDIVTARTRAVLVPFAAERETEQSMRAERLAALGAAELVRESDLSAASLAAAIERTAAHEPTPVAIDTDGANNSARIIAALIDGCSVPRLPWGSLPPKRARI